MAGPHDLLLERIAGGDENALSELYDVFHQRVYNTALGFLQHVEDAEEITQDVFVEIYRSAGRFQGNSSVSTWIYRIAVHRCLDRLRYKKRKRRFAFFSSLMGMNVPDPPDFEDPGVQMEKRENARILYKAIDTLPATQKTAFLLSFVEDLPRQEIADIMQVSLKALESLLQRAKANLRKNLDPYYPGRRKS
ncbi:MAG: RNA polymerase sigma factor [Saprospiraceae bacterium]